MKKIAMIAPLVLALSVSTMVEAKRGGGKVSRSTTTQKSQSQQDADFENTPKTTHQNTINQAQPQAQAQPNRLGNFVTGAAAGYLLSEALAPEAQAQTTDNAQTAPLNPQAAQTATAAVPTFKAIDPQNDPFLIEKTAGYSRYCLNGVQYLISHGASQLPPTLMVDKNNAPVQCAISQ